MSEDSKPASYRYQEALAPIARIVEDVALKKKLSEVLTLLDFNSTLNQSRDLSEILDLVLYATIGETRASWAGLLLRDSDDGLTAAARRGRNDESFASLRFPITHEQPELTIVDDEDVSDWARDVLDETGAVLLAPLVKSEKLVGVLLLGERTEPYGEPERMFTQALCVSAAAAIDNGRVYEQLQTLNQKLSLKVYQLDSLFDITRELNRSPDTVKVRRVLLTNAMGHVLTSKALMLQGHRVVEQRGTNLDTEQVMQVERASRALESLPEDCRAETLEDESLRELMARIGIDMVVPLRSGDASHGVLLLGPRASGTSVSPIGEADRDFLRALATQAASAIDNLRLTEAFIEKQKIEKEMALAREIQRGLLPDGAPSIEGWDVAGINIPCLTVGGDYYDYLDRGDDRYWIVIADVSGKGTGAALLMASVQAALSALAGVGDISLEALSERLNDIVYRATEVHKYVTAFFGSLDTKTGALSFVNAGHCYPMVLRKSGEVERLVDGSPVIGMLSEIEVHSGSIQLERGDVLLMYTDGLSETCNPAGEDFEEERIIELVRDNRDRSAQEVVARLVASVRVFAAAAGLADDLTLMVVRRV